MKIIARSAGLTVILLILTYGAMQVSVWVAGTLVILMYIGVLISGIRAELYDQQRRYKEALRDAEQDPSDRLRARIEKVGEAFGSAVTLMEELQRELASQEAAHRQLVEQANQQRALVGMDRDEAEAVQRLILSATKEDVSRQKRQQWIFFALGALVSVPIGVAINLLVP